MTTPSPAQAQGTAEEPGGRPPYCASLVSDRNDLLPLLPVCELAHSLPSTLPNFVCEQTATRSHRSPAGYLVAKDVILATVTYEDGREKYSAVTVNGRPTEQEMSAVAGAPNTFGEFGSFLAGVFSPESKAEVTSQRGEGTGSDAVRVFGFHVKQENNHWWVVRDSRKEVYPEIEGYLSVDSDSCLVALHVAAANMPAGFPVTTAELTITYGEVTIADLGIFRLPQSAEWTSCLRPIPWRRRATSPNENPRCFQNEIVFANYRKFAARSRIVPDAK